MSLAKTVPEGIRDKECKRFTIQECPPIPYLPEKDPIQETLSALNSDKSLKTAIREDKELRPPIWHCGMHEAFCMHVSTAIDAIKKQGIFKAHKEASELYVLYVEHCKAAKQAKAALAVLNATTGKDEKTSKKNSQKTKKGVALADAPDLELHAEYQTELEKAKFSAVTGKNKNPQ
jgi:hypothetical protein